MTDLNVALVLRLVDKATAPARAALRTIERAGMATQKLGLAEMQRGRESIAAAQARSGALLGEGAALAGMAYGMSHTLGTAIRFEAAMDKVGAISQASTADLERLTKTARKLGAETPWSASQAADGMQYLAAAGFQTNEIVAAMPGMLDLASAGGIELGRAADLASAMLNGFSLEAADMGRVGDVLTNTFNTSSTTLESLGETMKYLAPTAKSLGVEIETAAAMAGKLGDAGLQGSEAGTALRGIVSRLAAPTDAAAEVLDRLKVATADANGNLRDVPSILADLDEAMRGYGTAARSEMVKTLFETEAMGAATILMEEAGSGALQKYAQSLHESGSAARVAKQMNDNTAGALMELESRVESLSISLGTLLLPEVNDLIGKAAEAAQKAEAWGSANPRLVRSIVRIAAALLALKAALLAFSFLGTLFRGLWGAIRFGAGIALALVGALPDVFRRIWQVGGRALRALMVAFGRLRAVVWIAAQFIVAAFRWVGRALLRIAALALRHPLIAFLAFVVTLVASVFKHWEELKQSFRDNGFIETAKLAFRLLIDDLDKLFEAITGLSFDDVGNAIRAAFDIDLVAAGTRMITSLAAGIWSVLQGLVAQVQAKLEGILPDWLHDAWNWVSGGDGAAAPGNRPDERVAADGARAAGGPVRAGRLYRWNEEGEELFRPATDGHILTARETRALRHSARGGARAGASLSIGEIVIHAAPGQSAMEIARAVRREIERMARPSDMLHDGGAYAD